MKYFGLVLLGLSCSALLVLLGRAGLLPDLPIAATIQGGVASVAQTVEPSYKADPDTYKVIFEDANYRVIEANHKKGPARWRSPRNGRLLQVAFAKIRMAVLSLKSSPNPADLRVSLTLAEPELAAPALPA